MPTPSSPKLTPSRSRNSDARSESGQKNAKTTVQGRLYHAFLYTTVVFLHTFLCSGQCIFWQDASQYLLGIALASFLANCVCSVYLALAHRIHFFSEALGFEQLEHRYSSRSFSLKGVCTQCVCLVPSPSRLIPSNQADKSSSVDRDRTTVFEGGYDVCNSNREIMGPHSAAADA